MPLRFTGGITGSYSLEITMERMDAESIAATAQRFTGKANTAAINRAFRAQDESHLWPVRNRFDATERAIRETRRDFKDGGWPCEGLEYALSIDSALSRIVNGEV